MTEFIKHPLATGIIKLTGKIENYTVSRQRASFVFTESGQNKLGAVAIAASLAGMGGQAMAVASNVISTDEDADYVEFNLQGVDLQ